MFYHRKIFPKYIEIFIELFWEIVLWILNNYARDRIHLKYNANSGMLIYYIMDLKNYD